jgi:hypothetical protein
MVKNNVMVAVGFYDPEVGKELVVYGELEESKLEQFETNDDSWIAIIDSCRTVIIPKIDITRITFLKEKEDFYKKSEEELITKDKAGNLAII